jgi:glycine/D-amino acid oxidase-like deaminating enzyme
VVTEKGRIDCDNVILAAGAWSRLFCGNHDIDFPQLKVIASVMRTQPLAGLPMQAVGGNGFAFRPHLDGSYSIANRGASIAEIVPDMLRLFFKFLPALGSQRNSLRLRIGSRFLEEFALPRRWSLDRRSPFEITRVLAPKVDRKRLAAAQATLSEDFPAFADAEIVNSWAGLIDVTPDAMPVIGPLETIPGFFLASGFSGRGFGTGPAAGQLIVDILTGSTPIVDPRPFRFARLADGSRSRPY